MTTARTVRTARPAVSAAPATALLFIRLGWVVGGMAGCTELRPAGGFEACHDGGAGAGQAGGPGGGGAGGPGAGRGWPRIDGAGERGDRGAGPLVHQPQQHLLGCRPPRRVLLQAGGDEGA
ncbi:hypothetical protein GCM10018965_042400 [Nonomuraea roseola]